MISDESGQALHDRASRGDPLRPDERVQLDVWLTAHDQAESELLSPKGVTPALASLRSQVNSAFEQMSVVTRNIQHLAAENDSLRREVAALRSRLAARPLPQPA